MQNSKVTKSKALVFMSLSDTLTENDVHMRFLKELIPSSAWYKLWGKSAWSALLESMGSSKEYRSVASFEKGNYLKNLKDAGSAKLWFSYYAYMSSVKKHLYKEVLDGKKFSQIEDALKKTLKEVKFREGALRSIKHHQELGHFVVLVSSGLDLYLKPLAKKLGVNALVCTRVASYHGFFNGLLDGPECIYEQKIEELKAHGLLPWLHEVKKKNGFESKESFYEKDRVLTAREKNAKEVKEHFFNWYYDIKPEESASGDGTEEEIKEEGVIVGSPIEEEQSVKVRAQIALKEKQKEERWQAIKCKVICYGIGKKDLLLMSLASGAKESFFEPFRKMEESKGIKSLVKKKS